MPLEIRKIEGGLLITDLSNSVKIIDLPPGSLFAMNSLPRRGEAPPLAEHLLTFPGPN